MLRFVCSTCAHALGPRWSRSRRQSLHRSGQIVRSHRSGQIFRLEEWYMLGGERWVWVNNTRLDTLMCKTQYDFCAYRWGWQCKSAYRCCRPNLVYRCCRNSSSISVRSCRLKLMKSCTLSSRVFKTRCDALRGCLTILNRILKIVKRMRRLLDACLRLWLTIVRSV